METNERKPVITGLEGGPIELHLAAQWTKNYRQRHPGDTISQFFGREIINNVTNQEGSLGLRIYYANDQKLNGWQRFWVAISKFILKVIAGVDGNKHLIITGVTSDGKDLLPTDDDGNTTDSGSTIHTYSLTRTLGDQSYPCPGSTGCPDNILT